MKVGGHQKKPGRGKKAGGGGGMGRGGGGGGGGVAVEDEWRLSAAQKATLLEAYSDEPGTKAYMPNPLSGWRRQRCPLASSNVRILARVGCG